MTDPNPPTELDEIVVIGQRRRYHTDLFPSGGWEGEVSVYNHQNQQAAIAGTEGPEVNPEAQPCP